MERRLFRGKNIPAYHDAKWIAVILICLIPGIQIGQRFQQKRVSVDAHFIRLRKPRIDDKNRVNL